MLPAHRGLIRLETVEALPAKDTARLVITEARRRGELPQAAARAAGYALDTLRWFTAETLEAIASGLDTLAQKLKP